MIMKMETCMHFNILLGIFCYMCSVSIYFRHINLYGPVSQPAKQYNIKSNGNHNIILLIIRYAIKIIIISTVTVKRNVCVKLKFILFLLLITYPVELFMVLVHLTSF